MLDNKLFEGFFIFLFFVLINNVSSSSHSKYDCLKIDPHINSIYRTHKFLPIKNGEMKTLTSSESVKSLKSKLENTCQQENNTKQIIDFDNNLVELNWRVQYQKTSHCIRVELDFGKNLTKLNSNFNFNYYMFSYREFTKPNIYLNRNPLNESVNNLIINKAHTNSYVICVTFLKQNYDKVRDSENDATCEEYKNFLLSDERMHDTDLCVDVDIHSRFLNSHVESEDLNNIIKYTGIDPELIMALFIVILITTMLGSIVLAHYLIERPKRKQMLIGLRNYMRKDASETSFVSGDNIPNVQNSEYPEEVLDTGVEESLELLNKSNKNKKVTLMIPTFSIQEESDDEEVFDQKNTNQANLDQDKRNNISEADKSVSHLLDNKPWLNNN